MSRPVDSNTCTDGISQHTFGIRDVIGREGAELIVEWVCIDCDASFAERKPIDEHAYVSSEYDIDKYSGRNSDLWYTDYSLKQITH